MYTGLIKLMLTAHDRELIEALFEAADDDGDGFVDAEDIESVCMIKMGTCPECKDRPARPILYWTNEKMTLEDLLEINS